MRIGLIGPLVPFRAVSRLGMAAATALLALALAACTTVEGTNALVDAGTFEREVMSSTARGVGLIPGQEEKADLVQARAPLVLPRSGQALPPPAAAAGVAQLPVNSDAVRIDTSSLSEADIARLRNARVVDLRTSSGRPLTDAEARQLTARMQAANTSVTVNGERPLYLPPEEYFTRVGSADLVCAVGNGEVVSINDPKCPESVRKAIRATGSGPANFSSLAGGPDASLSRSDLDLDD